MANHTTIYSHRPKKDNKKGQQRQANMVDDKSVPIDTSEFNLSAVLSEANMVDNPS